MQTIVERSTLLSKYIADSDAIITAGPEGILFGNPPLFIISDLNSENSLVYSDVEPPSDWFGNKYFFDGDAWTLNPDWVDPLLEVIEAA